ncbi:hypothetical protein CVT25_003520, partial [Psilocybe cyanescens]
TSSPPPPVPSTPTPLDNRSSHDVEKSTELSQSRWGRDNINALALCTIWVLVGIGLMLSGTIVAGCILLPRIYKCPDGATCHHNFDPSGNIVPRLQTVITYWLQFGIFISGLGLSKLIIYDYHLLFKGKDTTVLAVERSISAADGDWIDTALQLRVIREHVPRRFIDRSKIPIVHGTSWVGILCLTQIVIGFFISFVVGFSIPDLQSTTTVHVPFTYRSAFTLPRADTRFFSTDERIVAVLLDDWLLRINTTRGLSSAFDGSLVVQDNRTILATNSRAGGPRITGSISCSTQGWNASILSLNSSYFDDGHASALPPGAKAYNISNNEVWLVTYSSVSLASTLLDQSAMSDSVTSRPYLWAGNTSNVIPNATASHDGGIFYAACNHTIRMDGPPPITASNLQTINPSQPIIFTDTEDPFLDLCPSNDPLACVPWSVDDIVAAWWLVGGVDLDLIPFSCLGGLLVGIDGISDTAGCALTDDRWIKTVSTALSALIFAAPLSGNATQEIFVQAQAINKDWWWIQTILPGVTFLLYLVCLACTWCLSMGNTVKLQELDLAAIICAGQVKEYDPGDVHNSIVCIQ